MITNKLTSNIFSNILFLMLLACLFQAFGLFQVAYADEPDSSKSAEAIQQLKSFLEKEEGEIASQPFASIPLTKNDALKAKQLLWEKHLEHIKQDTADEMKNKAIKYKNFEMKFDFKTFGEKPVKGHSFYISLHGGGNAPARVNTQQWENQKRLYQPKEGIYLAPRAPTDTWNLWHQAHIDPMFDRLIQAMVAHHDINPNRVYVMGYSAGGDGVYQIAPRMADRWAAAAMMAGHPNDASPLSLRNIGFTLHVGGRDSAYNRNQKGEEWKKLLSDLKEKDPGGYKHHVEVHKNMGHWMQRKDAVAVEWMAKFTRDPIPTTVIWKQDDTTQPRFYWLAVDKENQKARAELKATISDQTIRIRSNDVSQCTVYLSDKKIDLDKPIKISWNDAEIFSGTVNRTIGTLDKSMQSRSDLEMMFSASITVSKQ